MSTTRDLDKDDIKIAFIELDDLSASAATVASTAPPLEEKDEFKDDESSVGIISNREYENTLSIHFAARMKLLLQLERKISLAQNHDQYSLDMLLALWGSQGLIWTFISILAACVISNPEGEIPQSAFSINDNLYFSLPFYLAHIFMFLSLGTMRYIYLHNYEKHAHTVLSEQNIREIDICMDIDVSNWTLSTVRKFLTSFRMEYVYVIRNTPHAGDGVLNNILLLDDAIMLKLKKSDVYTYYRQFIYNLLSLVIVGSTLIKNKTISLDYLDKVSTNDFSIYSMGFLVQEMTRLLPLLKHYCRRQASAFFDADEFRILSDLFPDNTVNRNSSVDNVLWKLRIKLSETVRIRFSSSLNQGQSNFPRFNNMSIVTDDFSNDESDTNQQATPGLP